MATHETERDAAHGSPPVSVILTVLNESRHLSAAIHAILSSHYAGEIEVVIAVGPSSDGTREIADQLALQDGRIHVIENPSGRTPDGLNAALQATRSDIIVRIDGHAEIDPDYIGNAVEILQSTGAVNVGGLMAAEGITRLQKAIARAMRSPFGVGSSRFHTGGNAGGVDTVYLGVFRKDALLAIGGYDQRFTRAQDWEMNYRLREAGGVIWFDPRLKVIYRPRDTFKKLARQYFEYGRWRRAVSREHQGTINFRYLAPPVNLIINALSLLGAIARSPIFAVPTITYLVAILLISLLIGKSLSERVLLPLVLITMHFSWGFGFISSPRKLLAK